MGISYGWAMPPTCIQRFNGKRLSALGRKDLRLDARVIFHSWCISPRRLAKFPLSSGVCLMRSGWRHHFSMPVSVGLVQHDHGYDDSKTFRLVSHPLLDPVYMSAAFSYMGAYRSDGTKKLWNMLGVYS
jgi:hypothetical protein